MRFVQQVKDCGEGEILKSGAATECEAHVVAACECRVGTDAASKDFIKKCDDRLSERTDRLDVLMLMAPPEALLSGFNCETNQTCESFLFSSRSQTAMCITLFRTLCAFGTFPDVVSSL